MLNNILRSLLSVILVFISFLNSAGKDGYKRYLFIDIIHYGFNISISDSNDVIYGQAEILIKFSGPTGTIEFDLKNTTSDGKGMKVNSVSLSTDRCTWIHEGDRIIITTGEPVKAGSELTAYIDYQGVPADGLIIANNKYKSRTFFSDHWPDRASNYLPCIDHPYDKATVDFIITAPVHYEIVANGFLTEESFIHEGTKLTHWKTDVPLSTKVMAFGAAPFAVQFAGEVNDIPVWTWVFKENREEGFSDYTAALKPLSFYSELIGPYPFMKLANVQSKTIFGGLENAGCIFYSERSVTGNGKVENLMAHEIAHQWFGNSVTENDWHHIWLSEGFATYLTTVYLEMNYGREKLEENMKIARNRVLEYFMRSPRPVIDSTINNLMKLLNDNSYQKGAWVLHMLRFELGDDLFWQGIRLYYDRYMYRNALTEDFKNVMEEVSHRDLDQFFYQWLYIAGQPDLKFGIIQLPGKGRTEIIIEQQQDYLFQFNIELSVKYAGKQVLKNVPVNERITKITLKTRDKVEIIPDPFTNLLFRIMP